MKLFKKLGLTLGLMLAGVVGASAQGFHYENILLNQSGRPIVSARIYVCQESGTGTPCSPAALIYSDRALTHLKSQPIATGPLGNYDFYVSSGAYVLSFMGSSFASFNDLITLACTTDGSCGGGGGGGTPGSPTYALQYNLAGAFTGAAGITTPDGTNLYVKGPGPWADVVAYGARPVGFSTYPHTTVTGCTASSKAVTLASTGGSEVFRNGDGITLFGCGTVHGMTTPVAPTVTSAMAAAGTGLGGGTVSYDRVVVAGYAGASTYKYKVLARTKYGGLTATGAATTFTTGQATLGKQACTIATGALSGTTWTITTATPCYLTAGGLVHLSGTSNALLTGWFTLATVDTGTYETFTLTNTPISSAGLGWRAGDSTSSTGGNIGFYYSNHLVLTAVTGAWEYYVCAERPGESNYYLIGVTKPSSNGWIDSQFDDYGADFMASQTYPAYIETSLDTPGVHDAICDSASATSDPLTTTIDSGAGTTTLQVHVVAGTTASGGRATYDAAPGILAAANAVAGQVGTAYGVLYFPPIANPGVFRIESYLTLPGKLAVKQSGLIVNDEAIEISGEGVTWDGSSSNVGIPQFSNFAGSLIGFGTANPMLLVSGSLDLRDVYLNGNRTNGGVGIVKDAAELTLDHVDIIVAGGNNDYLSMALIDRSQSAGDDKVIANFLMTGGGPNQVLDKSWTPLIYFPPAQNGSGALLQNQFVNFKCTNCPSAIRGLEEELHGGNGGFFEYDYVHRQGGITPFIMIGNSNGNAAPLIVLKHIAQDTESLSTVASISPGNTGNITPIIETTALVNGSADVGGIPPPFSGTTPRDVHQTGSATGALPNTLGFSCSNFNPVDKCELYQPIILGNPNTAYIYAPQAAPSAPTAVLAAGGAKTNGTYQYVVTAMTADGRETVSSPLSNAITTNSGGGNSSISLTWPAVDGAVSYTLYECGVSSTCPETRWHHAGIVTNSYTTSTNVADYNPPTVTSAGKVAVDATGLYGPKVVLTSPIGGGGVSYKGTAIPGTLTATRTWTYPDSSTTLVGRSGSTSTGNLPIFDASGNLVDSGLAASGVGGAYTCVNVTPVTVNANTTSDQTLMACTITAATLNAVKKTILVQAAGVYSTPAASTATVTVKLKLCTVSGCGSGTVLTLGSWTSAALGAVQATNNPFNITLNFTTQTAGASAAFEAHGNLAIDIAASAAAAEGLYADNNTATVGAIDSTAQLFLQETISFSAASASNSATQRQLIADSVD